MTTDLIATFSTLLSISIFLKATCSSTPDHPLGINAIQSLGDTLI